MATSKALTIPNLIQAMKKAGFVTKGDIGNFVTKEDIRSFVTKKDIRNFVTKEDIRSFVTKKDIRNFVTKEDIRSLPTKFEVEEMIKSSERRMIKKINVVKKDLTQRIANIAFDTPTRTEFNQLKSDFEKAKSYL